MSGGPLTTWRCPECGSEVAMQITEGAQWLAGPTQVLCCPFEGCSGVPEIAKLGDIDVAATKRRRLPWHRVAVVVIVGLVAAAAVIGMIAELRGRLV